MKFRSIRIRLILPLQNVITFQLDVRKNSEEGHQPETKEPKRDSNKVLLNPFLVDSNDLHAVLACEHQSFRDRSDTC